MKQQFLAMAADQIVEQYRKPTRREEFLKTMQVIVPWAALCEVIEPCYPKAGNGRLPIGFECMLHIHFIQHWYFGMKLHIGVDRQSGLAHSAVVTAANVHDKHPLPDLLHGNEQHVYGDCAYASQKKLI